MKRTLLLLTCAAGLHAQLAYPDDARIYQELDAINQRVAKIQVTCESLAPKPPKHHSKFVKIMLKVLVVVDHTGSIASIWSMRGL